jgi:probable F420-dependent oxidoreductase
MRFTVEYPIGSAGFSPAFLEPTTVTRFAAAVEEAGVDAIAFTEHPAPSKKWLDHGGHESFDPLTALAFCAATTSRLRLMTYLLVLPYRNPLLAAKQIATLDVLSGGRTIIGLGGGYLRSEFAALGVEFEERNDLFDEGLEVLRGLWTTDEFSFEGRSFKALGQVSRPEPTQKPYPPVWVGGNSRKARQRVVSYGQGWAPIIVDEVKSTTTRTAPIDSVESLGEAIGDLRRMLEEAGRDPGTIEVQVQWQVGSSVEDDPAATLERIEQLAAVGVTWLCLNPPADDVERCMDLLTAYGDNIIRHAHGVS